MQNELRTFEHLNGANDLKVLWVDTVVNEYGLLNGDTQYAETIFDDYYHDVALSIYNSHRIETKNVSWIDFINDFYKESMCIIENGTLFDRNELTPPVKVAMWFKSERKVVKKESNRNLTEGDEILGQIQNVIQLMLKLLMNTYYGVSCSKYAKFFNMDIGEACTTSCRGATTVSAAMVEAFVGEYRYMNLGALVHQISKIKKEKYSKTSLDFLEMCNVNKEDLKAFLIGSSQSPGFISNIDVIVDKLDPILTKKLYFKNNFNAFFKTPYFMMMLTKLIDALNDNYREKKDLVGNKDKKGIPLLKAIYSDAYTYPENAKDIFETFITLIDEVLYGFYWYDEDYIEYEEMYAANYEELVTYMRRTATPLMDTDSNIICVHKQVSYLENHMIDKLVFEEDKQDYYTLITSFSIVTFFISKYLEKGLDRYGNHVNMVDKDKRQIRLKNEFYFASIILTAKKKNYISTIITKEGGVYEKPKLDVKGLSLIKSGFNDTIQSALLSMIESHLLAYKKRPDLVELIREKSIFQDKILQELKTEKAIDFFTILKLSLPLHENPQGEFRVKAVRLWNDLFPDNEIETPTSFYVVNMLFDEAELHKKFPNEYLTMKRKHAIHLMEKNFYGRIQEMLNLLLSKSSCLHEISVSFKCDNDAILLELHNEVDSLLQDLNKSLNGVTDMNRILSIISVFRKAAIEKRKKWEKVIYSIVDDNRDLLISTMININKMNKKFEPITKNNTEKKLIRIITMTQFAPLYKNENTKFYGLFKKIALPISSVNIPQIVGDFIDTTPFISSIDNLLSPVLSKLGLSISRVDEDKQAITNTIDYFR